MVSLDSTLVMGSKDKVGGDTQDRHILYGKYLTNLSIVVYSKKEQKLIKKRLSDNVVVYPTSSRKGLFLRDAYKISENICRENKIDVITTQDPLLTGLVGYLLKRKYDIPFNVQLHGNYLNNQYWLGQSKLNYPLNMLGNFVVNKADTIRVVSDEVRRNLVIKSKFPSEKLIVFPVFVSIRKFAGPQSINHSERFSGFENTILFVGRLSEEKNVESLLLAARKVLDRYPKTLFLIVGDGQMRQKLEKFARELKVEPNVRFEGAISYENIPSYYQYCDLLVLPSKHEGWGRVVIEALSCGKPVVVSDTCGVSEFVAEAKGGFVFPVDNHEIQSEQLLHLLQNSELRTIMGERGKERVMETMDINQNAHKYVELFRKTIELAGAK
ncbi:glycosyltransferase family 4 protein [Chloroflexota bacterium]